MIGVQVAWFGLFLILLQMATIIFANVLILAAAITGLVTSDLTLSLKLLAWGGLSFVVSYIVGFPGKFLCLGIPEEGARKLVILSVVCDIVTGILKYSGHLFSGQNLVMFLLGLGSFTFFLAFLARTGDNVGAPQVRRFIGLIYALFGTEFVLLGMLFFSPSMAILLMALVLLIAFALYALTIFTLFRAMPLYIEEVKLGYTDPKESAEERDRQERVERKAAMEKRGGPSKTKLPEVPTGTPPEGHQLYRIPKALGPLHLAVKEGDRIKLEDRIARGDDPRETVLHGLTPLHIASSGGVMEVANTLLAAGVEIDATCEEGLTPLYMAVQTANPFLVGLLLSRGASISHKNKQGLTPLHWACCVPHPNLEGPTRIKMVELLLENGADLSATTPEGKTAKDFALDNELHELVSFIDRRLGHPDPNSARSVSDNDAFEDTSAITESKFTPFSGAHLTVLPSQLPELHSAVKDGDPEKVYRQLTLGVSIKEPVAGGMTSLHITAITGVMSVTDLLLQNGAHVEDTYDHNLTPIFLAVAVNNLNMVGFLLSRKANVHHRDDMGRTPLHWASALSHEKLEGQNRVHMVKLLLEKGADPNIADAEGLRPVDLARLAEQEPIVLLLEAHSAPPVTASTAGEDEYY